jgi:hypothetical protein
MGTFGLKELAERTRASLTRQHAEWEADGGLERARASAEQERLGRVALGEETEDGESLVEVEDEPEEEDPEEW